MEEGSIPSTSGISPLKKRRQLNLGHLTLSEKQTVINLYKKFRVEEPALTTVKIVSQIALTLNPRADDYYLMSTPFWPIGICLLYLYFTFEVGPKLMKDRKPFDLRNVLIVFNLAQVLVNSFLVLRGFSILSQLRWSCAELDYSRNPEAMLQQKLIYIYFLTKLADLLDTLFFILRKNDRQITFLHVYHHFGMAALSWVGVKYFGGGHALFLLVINSFVHAVMYLYYLLSVWDAKYKRNIWWKKHITQLQLTQFVMMLYIYGSLIFVPDCRYPKIAPYFLVPQNLFMITLFGDFYYKAYVRPKTQHAVAADIQKDVRADDYHLMPTPFLGLGICLFYLYFTFELGPKLMKDRKPFDLKNLLIVFNLAQVLVNCVLVLQGVSVLYKLNWRCAEVDYSRSPEGLYQLKLAYIYFVVKISDLFDTVFFILRKRDRQISFLHVYHHFGMVILSWIGVKYFGGGHSFFIGVVNSFVHAVMYFYYLLSAWDKKYKNNIWWKKYITQLQLAQFVIFSFIYGSLLFVPDCRYPKIAAYFLVPQNLFMITLFGEFYYKAYVKPKTQRKVDAGS